MNRFKKPMKPLGSRLDTIFDSLLKNQDVWDFCCDHGLLGLRVYRSQEFKSIYFVDRVPQIMDKLENKFKQRFLDPENLTNYQFILSDGEKVQQIVEGNMVIAGVGTPTTLEILKGLQSQGYLNAQRLILAPQNYHDRFLLGMKEHLGSLFNLTKTLEVEESGRIRSIFIFDKSN
jgi:tRNA (adenine22-N1)-methyltransferase